MNRPECKDVQDQLPEWISGALDLDQVNAVEAHLSSCPSCAEEASLVRTLIGARPRPPAGLQERIQARVREEMARDRRPGRIPALRPGRWRPHAPVWAVSAAALVIVSLGIGVLWKDGTPEVMVDPVEVASQEPLPEAWLWDDGVVAGAPVYDDLTDEELQALIEEMEG